MTLEDQVFCVLSLIILFAKKKKSEFCQTWFPTHGPIKDKIDLDACMWVIRWTDELCPACQHWTQCQRSTCFCVYVILVNCHVLLKLTKKLALEERFCLPTADSSMFVPKCTPKHLVLSILILWLCNRKKGQQNNLWVKTLHPKGQVRDKVFPTEAIICYLRI